MHDVKTKNMCRLSSKVRKGFSNFDNTDLGLNAGLKRLAWWIDVRTIVTPLQATNLTIYIRTFLKWLSKLLKGEVQKTIEKKKSNKNSIHFKKTNNYWTKTIICQDRLEWWMRRETVWAEWFLLIMVTCLSSVVILTELDRWLDRPG